MNPVGQSNLPAKEAALRYFRMRCGRIVHVPDTPEMLARAKRYGWREVAKPPSPVSK